jgi:hypothetical protein
MAMSTPEPTARTRYPLGVIVLVAITAVRALTLVFELANVQGGELLAWIRGGGPLPTFPPGSDLEFVSRFVIIGLLATSALAIYGLLFRRRWAWVLSIISAGLILALDLGWWWAGEPRYISMLVNTIAVFYLNQREVRVALRGEVRSS